VVLVLFEAYSGWTLCKNVESVDEVSTFSYDRFEGEQSFYFVCLETIAGKLRCVCVCV
jgi:hypothetical protein